MISLIVILWLISGAVAWGLCLKAKIIFIDEPEIRLFTTILILLGPVSLFLYIFDKNQ